jgi:HEPN domain-containing protein
LHDPGKIFAKYTSELQVTVPEDVFDFFAGITTYYLNMRYQNYKENVSSKFNNNIAERSLKKLKRFLHGF